MSFQVCHRQFSGYAELRDHVQSHGDGYRDPYGNRHVRRPRDPPPFVEVPEQHITIVTAEGDIAEQIRSDQITIIASAMDEPHMETAMMEEGPTGALLLNGGEEKEQETTDALADQDMIVYISDFDVEAV